MPTAAAKPVRLGIGKVLVIVNKTRCCCIKRAPCCHGPHPDRRSPDGADYEPFYRSPAVYTGRYGAIDLSIVAVDAGLLEQGSTH
jgi:hypothetical protein